MKLIMFIKTSDIIVSLDMHQYLGVIKINLGGFD